VEVVRRVESGALACLVHSLIMHVKGKILLIIIFLFIKYSKSYFKTSL